MNWPVWTKKLWRTVSIPVSYAIDTAKLLLKQLATVPGTLATLVKHEPSRKISQQMIYIAGHDLLPLLLVNFGHHWLQRGLASQREEMEVQQNLNFLIYTVSSLLQTAVSLYNFRQGTQMTVRTALLLLQAPNTFNELNPTLSPLCGKEDKCTVITRLKGHGREWVELTANNFAIYLLSQIPYTGPLSQVASIYVSGRYISKITLPERCPNHHSVNSKYALALGLGHASLVASLEGLFSATLGLPPAFCLEAMRNMMLIWHFALAAHLRINLLKTGEKQAYGVLLKNNNDWSFDPVELLENASGWLTKVVSSGLLKQVPHLLKKGPANFPWKNLLNHLQQLAEHPVSQKTKLLLLPPMLQTPKAFISDPLVNEFWVEWQKQLDTGFGQIIHIGENKPLTFQLASWAPKTTATALKLIVGIPKPLTRGILILIDSQTALELLRQIQRWIRNLNKDPIKLVDGGQRMALYLVDKNNTAQDTKVQQSKEEEIPASELLGKSSTPDPGENLFNEEPKVRANDYLFFSSTTTHLRNTKVDDSEFLSFKNK